MLTSRYLKKQHDFLLLDRAFSKRIMWERSPSVPFPSVWRRFKGRKEINGEIPNFWIQDIPEEEFETVIDTMIYRFCKDEPLTKFSSLLKDLQSIADVRIMWENALKNKLGIICYMENPNKNGKPIFAGVNCTFKKDKENKDHGNYTITGKAYKKVIGAMDYLMDQKDAFEVIGADVLLSALGLYVFPEFRGQNIGTELLNAREDICKGVGIKASITIFSATASQILASRVGYKVLFEITYEDLQRINSEFHFPGIENHTKTIQYCYKIF